MNNETIGKFILELRKSKNMTQQELGLLLNYSRNNISKWENGISIPSDPKILEKLSQIFDVSIEEIMYGKRKSKVNIQQIIDNVVLKYKQEYKKRRKILIFNVVLFFLLIFCFIWVFYNNYIKGTITIYHLSIDNENYVLDNSFLFFSNERFIFNLNKIENLASVEEILYVEVYFYENGKKTVVLSGINDFYLLEEENGENKFNLNKLKKRDIYISLSTESKVINFKLKKNLKYINNKINYNIPDYSTGIQESDNFKKYDKSVLLDNGFVTSDNVFFIKRIKYGLVEIKSNTIQAIFFEDEKNLILNSTIGSDLIYYYIYQDGKLIEFDLINSSKAINCDVSACDEKDDYVSYLYYLSRLIMYSNE